MLLGRTGNSGDEPMRMECEIYNSIRWTHYKY